MKLQRPFRDDVKSNNAVPRIAMALCSCTMNKHAPDLFCTLSACLLCFGCSNSTYPILIILPNDYRGEFSIVKDDKNGQKLALTNNTWVLNIPDSGVLYVSDDRPFYKWHGCSFRYRDGRAVAVEDLGTRAGKRSVGSDKTAFGDFNGTRHMWKVIPTTTP
jgi:hypothetical protein